MKTLSFTKEGFEPIELCEGDNLSEVLNVKNSPILFGCRTGLCGTCLIEVVKGGENLHARTEDEADFLDAMHPENKKYRLGCQISIDADITVRSKKEIEGL